MLRLVNVEKAYGAVGGPTPILRGVSFSLAPGGFCALLGPSGSGKSTLLQIAGLLDRPSAGQVLIDGAPTKDLTRQSAARIRNRSLGFVFQAFHLLPRLNAWENVALPLLYAGTPRPDRRPQALAALAEVGLTDRAEHRPSELSGGERQRVAIARALVRRPKLILADEPTGSLDSKTAADVMDLLRKLNIDLALTILMVTHDRDLAQRCDRRIELLDGRIVGDSAPA